MIMLQNNGMDLLNIIKKDGIFFLQVQKIILNKILIKNNMNKMLLILNNNFKNKEMII